MTETEFRESLAGGFIALYGDSRLRVKLSRWTKSGVRVKFLDGTPRNQFIGRDAWQVVHPGELHPTKRLW